MGTTGRAGSLVAAEGVSVRFGRAVALADVDLTIQPDDFLGIVGPSGAGKTTLLRTILDLQRPSGGRVSRRRGLRTGYVPQVGAVDLTFPLSVAECVLLARARQRALPWPTRSERARVDELLSRLGLDGFVDRHLRDLSGGQLQRVFIARALMGEPDLLVLDEPTSGIDVSTRHEVLHLLAQLHRSGPAIVLATHDLNGLAAHLPHIVCLNRRVVGDGRPVDVLTPQVLEATFGAPFEVLVHAGLPVVLDRRLDPVGHQHPHQHPHLLGQPHLDHPAPEPTEGALP